MTIWQLSFFFMCLAISLICFFGRLKMAATAGQKKTLVLASFRFPVLLIIYYLIWQIFWDKDLQQKKVNPVDPTSKSIIALVDHSKSMDHKTVNGKARKELGEEVLDYLKKEAAEAKQDLKVNTVLFSKNLYEPRQANLSNPEYSEINQAIIKTVQRQDLNALLLISDGAATDQALTSFTQKWINNRGLKTYSTLTDFLSSKPFDFMIKAVEFDPVKADKIPFKGILQGAPQKDVKLNFEIDDKLIQSFKTNISGTTELFFKIPDDLPEGWHKYSIYSDPVEGDLSLKNNLIKGVFKRLGKSKILYLTGSPRREDISIIRFLKKKYPDRMQHISIYNPDFLKMKPDSIKFLIVGDVPYKAVPNTFLEQYYNKSLGIFLLATDSLSSWANKTGFDFNISESINFDKTADNGWLKPENNLWEKFDEALNLKVRNIYKFDGKDFSSLLAVSDRIKRYPLIVKSKKTKLGILLTDLTWKWDLNAETKVRKSFYVLWNGITTNLLDSFLDEKPIKINIQKNETSFKITSSVTFPYTISDLKDLKLTLKNDFSSEEIASVLNSDVYEKEILMDGKKGIYFVQASGRIQGRKYHSEAIPVDFSELSEEDYKTIADEEFLTNGQFGKESFSDFEKHRALVKRIVADLSPVKTINTRNRYPLREIILALIILTLLGSEWFLERKYVEGT